MRVTVVSLKRSLDRREEIEKQLLNLNINFDFFDAIDGNEDNFLNSNLAAPEITYKRKGYNLLHSEIACFSSHLEIWKLCVQKDEPFIVLEDNVNINPEFARVISSLGAYLERYEYIKLSATKKSQFKSIDSVCANFQLVKYCKNTRGTTGYIITPSAAEKFILGAQNIIEPVDDYMEKAWRHNVECVHVQPDIVTRSGKKSTIFHNRKNKQKIPLTKKIYIEIFRVYEFIQRNTK
ncbi:glycosyltransferase family 25 protein [Vibrio algivorus]|uniref:Glycosyltransferase family 25 protein n=1 Tax=Vibrio algivorus TaxID=1667024 RepID=A0A557P5L6_9VIBR|nr:glycosyltransferase family 25 protein [Vibrio algivorus]TVO35955.1 glycosyltransferase family 25 protein [Vibrio algivorus]